MKLLLAAIFYSFLFLSISAWSVESVCYGETKNGRIENAVPLPFDGNNFESYSYLGEKLGRNYVHSVVQKIVINAYKNLQTTMPAKKYKYGETGFENGGIFKPHKTHQNGLSIDFMVPVINAKGESVYFSTNMFNKWGYAEEFDQEGKLDDLVIDFEALAAHLVELDKESKKAGFKLWRVIFDIKLQAYLFKTSFADYLKTNIQFSTKPAWVRHDEHYHVDFDLPCKKLK